MITIALFNNKGGVGKTSLVYHLAWMFADQGIKTLAVDLDPQANLSACFLTEEELEHYWPDGDHPETIHGVIQPILRGTGDIAKPTVADLGDNLGLLVGDLGLSRFEDKLSDAWPRCHSQDEAAFRATTAFHRLIEAGSFWGPELALIDIGPNLGAINRSALIAADYVCLPLSPDLFSLQGLKNLGPTLREWREDWATMMKKSPSGLSMPKGSITPVGYVVMQHGITSNRPVKSYQRWMDRIPDIYLESVLNSHEVALPVEVDPHCLALLKHYRSLMPMAIEARKPIFHLKSADGALGSHIYAVKSCYDDFLALTRRLAKEVGLNL
ncbi:AAA family ATPase [bacterium]|nr:AAA family ATPase [bacterium]